MSPVGDPESDLTRKQRREQARGERKALEKAERELADRRKRFTQIGGALIVVAVVGIIVALVATSGSKKAASSASTSGSGAETDLLATPAPWPPQYAGLLNRIVGAHFPPYGTNYHVHSVLQIYIEGKQVPLASQIGIDQQESYLAPLHTHDSSGIIHMEATEPYPFKLSQFFTVWGVKFTPSQIGAYKAGNGNVLALYANGTQVANPTEYTMKPHDRLVLNYGKPKTFVKEFSFTWPAGL
jgi:hypothetical protein